ncbi:MAG: hypothetical protein RBR47_09845, partial [Bacteroidales bacterium]|nr:hypothetical protein [Bacteroidales bacterium]
GFARTHRGNKTSPEVKGFFSFLCKGGRSFLPPFFLNVLYLLPSAQKLTFHSIIPSFHYIITSSHHHINTSTHPHIITSSLLPAYLTQQLSASALVTD